MIIKPKSRILRGGFSKLLSETEPAKWQWACEWRVSICGLSSSDAVYFFKSFVLQKKYTKSLSTLQISQEIKIESDDGSCSQKNSLGKPCDRSPANQKPETQFKNKSPYAFAHLMNFPKHVFDMFYNQIILLFWL